ncbi:hypothetical protein K227x_30840 [Rubripirellula lacrimiformis]|uniref:Uncharacterized protein n=1 Tax=Rubripirellula lacrimiformis TaxID=1930273 RepID=A0A517NC33_9BACT|nr:hypothetical protein [Rubripirellula lacrimiformis]QDT04690.1 hypothetical protein K227x_30840 [Rubripirellula lacrimiformis]
MLMRNAEYDDAIFSVDEQPSKADSDRGQIVGMIGLILLFALAIWLRSLA